VLILYSTYRSLYFSVIGTAAVSNSCGLRGATHTSPTPVAVTAMTSISYSIWPSTCGPSGQAAPSAQSEATTGTLAVSDIACPTWDISDPLTTKCDGLTFLTSIVGKPYNPISLAPSELLPLDPAWVGCSAIESTSNFVLTYGIYDPLRTLQSTGALAPEKSLVPAPKDPTEIVDPPPIWTGGNISLSSVDVNAQGGPDAHDPKSILVPPSYPAPVPVGQSADPTASSTPAAPQDTGSPGLPQWTTAPASNNQPPVTLNKAAAPPADPGHSAAACPPFDPDSVSLEQMSQLEQALQPSIPSPSAELNPAPTNQQAAGKGARSPGPAAD